MKLYKVTKEKSGIKGFWLDNGKLHRDNISVDRVKSQEALQQGIKRLFASGELAIFYTDNKQGYCVEKSGRITILKYRLRLHRQKLSVKEFKKLVSLFGGLTVYKLYDRYIIEVYHN